MNGRTERPLGRGLGALIPQRSPTASGTAEIPLARIQGNPHQPRQHFDHAELEALASSIREHGVIQPILVTESAHGYQLIAGERRVRAARLAGLERIPAVIRQLADSEQLELALVENLQREDLNPIESAHAYRQLDQRDSAGKIVLGMKLVGYDRQKAKGSKMKEQDVTIGVPTPHTPLHVEDALPPVIGDGRARQLRHGEEPHPRGTPAPDEH